MEAEKLKTVDDLMQVADDRVELINGEIHKRPMARSEHALIQSGLSDEVSPLKRRGGVGGWWIMTEVSVRYSEHNCPVHDLAGWRKERLPQRPAGMMTQLPDWVCEITSPGHERKDMFSTFMLLQRQEVPYYWVISPEDQTLIAYELADEHYKVVYSVECGRESNLSRVFVPPFADVGIDLGYVFGVDDPKE